MGVGTGKRLLFGKDLTALPAPLRAPNANSPHVLIVGGGVIGLVNAWVLLDHGYHVTVLAKEWASYGKTPRLTSQIAGALWEYPPAVCGQHTDAISLLHSKRWCMIAYHIWDAIAASEPLAKQAGVRMKPADFFFGASVRENPQHLAKMQEIMSQGIRGFRHDPAIIEERGIEAKFGAVDAYEHLAPIIDTDVCMKFLEDIAIAKGAKLVTRTIKGDLFYQEQALRSEFGVDIIINCTGLAGTELAGDRTCYPIRGALIRVINDGTHFPKLEHALTMASDATNGVNEIVFLVPRNDNILLIGGITEPDIHSLDLTLDSPIIKRMRARCDAFLPGLQNAKLDSDYPLAQGLRPFRQHNVRVERELRSQAEKQSNSRVCSRIIHSYGHGGAGWSLSFGCASDVLALVEEALRETPPTPMRLEFAERARI